ncbi:replication initiator [Streptomyces sp. M10(2022)]
MIRTAWALGHLPEFAELKLWKWAHMLGFRGHFSTKSRAYSTTLGALRDVRRAWRTAQAHARTGLTTPTRTPPSSPNPPGNTSPPATAPAKNFSPPRPATTSPKPATEPNAPRQKGRSGSDHSTRHPHIDPGGSARRTPHVAGRLLPAPGSGRAPRHLKLPNGQIRIRRTDLDAWFDGCEVPAC